MARDLASRLGGGGNRLMRSFGTNTQPLGQVTAPTQGINFALQELLSGIGIGQDEASRSAAMKAIQGALIADPATVTGPKLPDDEESTDTFGDTGLSGYEAEEVPNPKRRSLQERLGASGEGMENNPYMQSFQQSLIPGRLQQELAKTQLDETRAYNAGLATTKRAQQLADMAKKQENAIALKKMPGSMTGRPAAPIQNYEQRTELVGQFGEGSPQVRQFDTYVRANKIVDFGDKVARFDPQNPGSPVPVGNKGVPPQLRPEHRASVVTAEAEAKNAATIKQTYRERGIKSEAALDALAGVEKLIEKSTGSYGGAAFDMLAAVFGKAPEGALAVGQLKVLQANLMLSQPRMEGPQSDKDVMLYREAAGQIGDPTVPNAIKLQAMKTIKSIHARYTAKGASQNRPVPTSGFVPAGAP